MEKKDRNLNLPRFRSVSVYSKEAMELGDLGGLHETWDDEVNVPIPDRMRVNFWIDGPLYYAIKQKLLDHRIATRERITITDICTEALQNYINPKEGNENEN